MLSVVATRCLQNKFDEASARFARIRTLSHSHAQRTQFLMMNFIFGEEKEMPLSSLPLRAVICVALAAFDFPSLYRLSKIYSIYLLDNIVYTLLLFAV